MAYKDKLIEFYKKQAELKAKEPYDKVEIAKLIDKYFPKEIKIFEIQHYPFMEDREYGVVIFHKDMPHKPIPLVWNVEKKEIELFDEKAERNIKEVEEKTNTDILTAINFINNLKYRNLIEIVLEDIAGMYALSMKEEERNIAKKIKEMSKNEIIEFAESIIKEIVKEEEEYTFSILMNLFRRGDTDEILFKRRSKEEREALLFIESLIAEKLNI